MNSEASPVLPTSRRLRWFCAFAIIAATFYSVLAVSFVSKFEGIYKDLLSSSPPLPSSAAWLLNNYPYLLGALLLLTGLTLWAIFRHRSMALAIAAAGVAAVLHIAVGMWISNALLTPLIPVFQKVSQ